jgi:hypothetical protein
VKEFVIEKIKAFQMKQGIYVSGAPHAPETTRIPDDDLSVCTLHPDRTAIARRLIASVDFKDRSE